MGHGALQNSVPTVYVHKIYIDKQQILLKLLRIYDKSLIYH